MEKALHLRRVNGGMSLAPPSFPLPSPSPSLFFFLLFFSFSSPFRRRGRVPLCIHLHWKCPMFSYLLAEDNVTIYVMAEKKKGIPNIQENCLRVI